MDEETPSRLFDEAPRHQRRMPETRLQSMDIHVGSRVRLRRTLLRMSQEDLGEALHISFQQVQKYERGANRISASRLYDLARALDVPVSYFFDGFDEARMPPPADGASPVSAPDGAVLKHDALELVRAYWQISDPRIKLYLFELAKTLAKADDGGPPQPEPRVSNFPPLA